MRKLEAARRQDEREAKKRQRELERSLKDQEKRSALEQARLEVDAYENSLEVLLSVHKEQHEKLDWKALAYALPPHEPLRLARSELAAMIKPALRSPESVATEIEKARSLDELEHQTAYAEFEKEFVQWTKLNSLAKGVLAGETSAYTKAVSEFPILAEISILGSSIHMTAHNKNLVECVLKVNSPKVIPLQVKSLTAAGKLVEKPMPKARFHELYQDYVSGCILRLARELFALLPIETVLLSATVDGIDSRKGLRAELPVLSMIIHRAVMDGLNFDCVNPSDALDNFQHRGDMMTSKKSGDFIPIVPLTPSDIDPINIKKSDISSLISRVKQLRKEFSDFVAAARVMTASANNPNV